MFLYKAANRAENEIKTVRKLEAELKEVLAQLDYIAMMCEVEILDFERTDDDDASEVECDERKEQICKG